MLIAAGGLSTFGQGKSLLRAKDPEFRFGGVIEYFARS
jgi:hypothetical protein